MSSALFITETGSLRSKAKCIQPAQVAPASFLSASGSLCPISELTLKKRSNGKLQGTNFTYQYGRAKRFITSSVQFGVGLTGFVGVTAGATGVGPASIHALKVSKAACGHN
jgi:hypothetical protein